MWLLDDLLERIGFLLSRGSSANGSSGSAPRSSSGSAPRSSSGTISGANGETYVKWSVVEDTLAMTRDALQAKKKVTEVLRAEMERLHEELSAESEQLSKVREASSVVSN